MVKQKNEYKIISAVRMMGLSHWDLLKVNAWWDSVGADPRSHHPKLQCQPSLALVGQSSAKPSSRDAVSTAQGWRAQCRTEELQLSPGQPSVGKVRAGLGAAPRLSSWECCLRNSSIPNSPACTWLPLCLETRKFTEQCHRDEAATELVLASTAGNTSLLLHLPRKK